MPFEQVSSLLGRKDLGENFAKQAAAQGEEASDLHSQRSLSATQTDRKRVPAKPFAPGLATQVLSSEKGDENNEIIDEGKRGMKNGRAVDTGNTREPNNMRKVGERGTGSIYPLMIPFNA